MKNNKKFFKGCKQCSEKVSLWFLIFSVIFNGLFFPKYCLAEEVEGDKNIVSGVISEEVYAYADSVVDGLVSAYEEEERQYSENSIIDFDALKMGEPCTIFSYDSDQHPYYFSFPIYEGNEIKLMLDIIPNDTGYDSCLGIGISEQLNELNWDSEQNHILFACSGDLYIQDSNDETVLLESNADFADSDDAESIIGSSFVEKVTEIEEETDVEINNISEEISEISSDEMLYGASFSVNKTYNRELSFPMVMQTDRSGTVKPVCWAACVASLINCCQGRTTSNMLYAYNVVEAMGTGYIEVGTSTVLSAIQHYQINYYRSINGQASYSSIVSGVSAMRPIIMGSVCGQYGHMTLVTGYYSASQTNVNGGGTFVMYNPGTGNRSVVTYNSSGSTFTYSGNTYTWNKLSIMD